MGRESYIDYVDGLDLNDLLNEVLKDDKPETELEWWVEEFGIEEIIDCLEPLYEKAEEKLREYLIDNYSEDDYRPDYDD